MTMRRATEAEIPRILQMGEALAARHGVPQAVDRVYARAVLSGMMHDPAGLVLATDGGFIVGRVTRSLVNPAPIAVEAGWHATDGSGFALLGAYEAWAEVQRATLVHVSTADARVQRALARRGYRMAEVQMVREV